MRGLLLLRPLPIAQVAANSGDGAAFLGTPDPKEVYRAGAAGWIQVNIDLGAVSTFDTIFVGHTNAVADAAWRIERTSSIGGGDPVTVMGERAFPISGSGSQRPHGLFTADEAITTRFLRLNIRQTLGFAPFEAGTLLVGTRIEQPYEYKSGRRLIDLSERVEMTGGGFGFGRGAVKASFRFTLADIDDAKLRTLWRLIREQGNQHPVLLVEGGDGAIEHDQLHYCVFGPFEAYERDNPDDTRWSLQVTDWT